MPPVNIPLHQAVNSGPSLEEQLEKEEKREADFIKNLTEENLYFGSESYIGLSIMHYWMPYTLSKFVEDNTEVNSYDGGSTAILIEYGWFSY